MEQILNLIGLAKKAGRLEVGEEPVGAAARARQVRLLLVAADAAPGSARRAQHFAEAGQCLLLTVPCAKAELGRAVGCTVCAMAALTDIGFASAIVNRLAQDDPKTYGSVAEALEVKAKRAMERRREQIRHEKNLRRGIKRPAPKTPEDAPVRETPPVQEAREAEIPAPRQEQRRGGFSGARQGGSQKPPYRSHEASSENAGRRSGFHSDPAKDRKPGDTPRRETDAKPYGRNEGGAKPYRKNEGGAKPYRRNEGDAKPYGRSEGDAKPFRKNGGGAKPYRRNEGDAKPYGRSEGDAKPFRKNGGGAKPYGRSGQDAKPYRGGTGGGTNARRPGSTQGKAPGRPGFGSSERRFPDGAKKAFYQDASHGAARFSGSRPVKRGKGSDHKQKN